MNVIGLLRSALAVTPAAPPASSSSRRLVRRAKEFVQEHVSTPLRLCEIAAAVGASAPYLTDLFRRIEGIPLHRYVMQLRLARALVELPHANDLTMLAVDLGFSSHSHFTSALSQIFGVGPRAGRTTVGRGYVRRQPSTVLMCANQTHGRGHESCVIRCLGAVWQLRHILQPGTDAMASIQSALIDCPTRQAVPVMDLFQGDARGQDYFFHPGRVLESRFAIAIQRLDENAPASLCQARTHESPRIVGAQQPGLDSDPSGQQQIAEIYNPRLALVRRNEVRHFLPRFDDAETLPWVAHNRR